MDFDELFDLLCESELRAGELTELRRALEARLEGIRRARRDGELVPADLAELRQHLQVLREEELIAEFIERGLKASKKREEILAELGQRDDPNN